MAADGDLTTAWNSASNDERAWLRLGLPSTSVVHAFEITPGYASGELFRQNRRIRRVSVHHNGHHIGDYTLDIETPTPQRFDLGAPLEGGGEIEIRVEEFVPGTRSSWTELCISEVRLWGVAQTLLDEASPICSVGEPTEEVEPSLQRFERLNREARQDYSDNYAKRREALSVAMSLLRSCPAASAVRNQFPEVVRMRADPDGRLPRTVFDFAADAVEAARDCGFDAEFQDAVHGLVALPDDYEPD